MSFFDFNQNYFELFGLPVDCAVDELLLQAHYRRIQAEVHPDRFAGKPEQEQRLAVQMAGFVNEAYQCLKQPLRRAQYLLELAGHAVLADGASHQDADFLFQQMSLREELEAIVERKHGSDLDAFVDRIAVLEQGMEKTFAEHYRSGQYQAAVDEVLKWQFLVKLRADAQKHLDLLD